MLIHTMHVHPSGMREFTVKYRQHSTFGCKDDKHSIQAGEPGYPVAAVEHGKQILVRLNERMVLGDHDFTKYTLTPRVNLLVKILETMENSFYRGKVFVGLREVLFRVHSLLAMQPN